MTRKTVLIRLIAAFPPWPGLRSLSHRALAARAVDAMPRMKAVARAILALLKIVDLLLCSSIYLERAVVV